jgi:hypothetical protein
VPICLVDATTTNWTGWYLAFGASNTLACNSANANSFGGGSTAPGSFSSTSWNVGCGVFASSTSRTCYLNGFGGATDTNSINPSPTNIRFGLGASIKGGGAIDNYAAATIGYAACWARALSPQDVLYWSNLTRASFPNSEAQSILNFWERRTIYSIPAATQNPNWGYAIKVA